MGRPRRRDGQLHLGPGRAARHGATISALDRDEPPAATGLPTLDGILAANLLRLVRDQGGLLGRLRAALRPGGRLLVVEYEQPAPIPWVPHPLPFSRLAGLASEAGSQPPA